jgi:hypothetical protein
MDAVGLIAVVEWLISVALIQLYATRDTGNQRAPNKLGR